MSDSLLYVPCASKRLSEAQPCIITLVIIDAVAIIYFFSCPMACGIFLDWGLNPYPLHWRWILNHSTTREVPLL